MIKVTFLGTGTSQGVPVVGCDCEVCTSSNPKDHRLRTSAFVEVDQLKLLIDAGPDLRQQLLTNKITDVDAILVTHEHKDHVGGIDDIRPINFLNHKTIDIYGLPRTLGIIKKDFDYAFAEKKYPGVPNLRLQTIKDEQFRIGDIEIIPIHILHLAMPILGYRIQNFAYITDASFIAPKELEKLMGLDTLVINALGYKEHYSHFNIDQALAIIDKLQPRQAFFTHMSHRVGKYDELSQKLPNHVHPAYDGLTVKVGI